MFDVTLIFAEDFLDFDVYVRGFESEEIAKEFTNSNSWLCLSATGLELVIGGSDDSIGYPIDRERVAVKLDTRWNDRIPLDPSKPENMAKITQAMVDFENGVENIYNIKAEDYQLVSWSFEEVFEKLKCTKAKLAMRQCLAYRISPSTSNNIDTIAAEWMASHQ